MEANEIDGGVLELGDWPGGTITYMECRYPDAPDGGIDLALSEVCLTHQRTVWWCLNARVVWCDGGPPEYPIHTCSLIEDLPY